LPVSENSSNWHENAKNGRCVALPDTRKIHADDYFRE